MLLTLNKPAKWNFDYKPHAYSPPSSSSATLRHSPKPRSLPPQEPGPSSYAMSTSHRGLPPPSAMTLPDPNRGPPPPPPMSSSLGTSLGSLPPAPSQWQGSEDGMKNWLAAKAEEDRRKQEEEKTRQESLKLEQRKIEQSILRESIQGGIPPHLVPIVFAGMGGGSLANISAEWIQQYTVQVQAAQAQVQAQAQAQAQAQLSPDLRREPRLIGQPQPVAYAGQAPVQAPILPPTAVLPGQPLPTQPQHAPLTASPYVGGNMSPRARAAQAPGHPGVPISAPHSLHQSQLPRLTTNEMSIQQPPSAQPGAQQVQQNQAAQQQEQTSPSIYFHHWVPPNSQQEKSSSGQPPATPSGKYKASPSTSHQSRQRATSHASDLEYTSSPKKRKAQGPHQAAPAPTSAPQSHTSPSFSHVSTSSTSTSGRRGHVRARSDASTRGADGSSVSRRGTVSGHPHEMSARQTEAQESARKADVRYAGHPDAAYAPPLQRHDSRGGYGQQHAPSSAPAQHETPNYGTQQPWNRGYLPSPKREADR